MSDLDTGIVLVYFALMIAIGIYASRRQNDVADYFTAGGRVGTVSIACLWLAGWTGGAAIIGGTARAYDIGISAGWYIASMAIGCLLFGLFMAARVKRLSQQHGSLTYPELIESRYGSGARMLATVSTIIAQIGFAAGQMVASAVILQTLFGWSFDFSLVAAAVVIIVYTAVGGFLAVTYTDWVQVTIFFVGVVLIGMPLAVASGGNWSTVTTSLPAGHFDIGAWGWPAIFAMLVSISLTFFTTMDSYTRCFAARTPTVARNGTLIAAGLLLPLMIGAVWLGLTTRVIYPDIADNSDVLTRFVIEEFPVGLKGFLLAGMLSAIMSTADISILTASANASRDIYQRYLNPGVSEQRLVRISIGTSAAIGVLATLLAWKMQDIIAVQLIAFTVNAAALFVPTIALLYTGHGNRRAAFWSMLLSLSTVLLWYIASEFNVSVIAGIDPLWPGLAVSVGVFFLISKFSGSKT